MLTCRDNGKATTQKNSLALPKGFLLCAMFLMRLQNCVKTFEHSPPEVRNLPGEVCSQVAGKPELRFVHKTKHYHNLPLQKHGLIYQTKQIELCRYFFQLAFVSGCQQPLPGRPHKSRKPTKKARYGPRAFSCCFFYRQLHRKLRILPFFGVNHQAAAVLPGDNVVA